MAEECLIKSGCVYHSKVLVTQTIENAEPITS